MPVWFQFESFVEIPTEVPGPFGFNLTMARFTIYGMLLGVKVVDSCRQERA